MREVAIVESVRTPVGNYGGSMRDVKADVLGALVIQEILERTGIDARLVDDVVLGQSYSSGEHPAIGRLCSLKAGLPIEVPGYQLDRRCASGLQAILNAAMLIQTNNADVVIAGGVESMSGVEYYTTEARWGGRLGSMTLHDRLIRAREQSSPDDRFGPISGMLETAENLAKKYDISREEQDKYALASHRKAVDAQDDGKFIDEIVPVEIPQRRKDPIIFKIDEGPRRETTLDRLSKLRPVLKQGTVTAGNASSQNDAASVSLIVAAEKLDSLGLKAMAYLKGWSAVGVHPAYMGIGPVPAVDKLFKKTGLNWDDIDLVELNEAFAAQAIAVLREWNLPRENHINVNGSGISLGHPIAATGARILTTLLYEARRRNAKIVLETMCVGGGQGVAAALEVAY